MNRVRFAVVLGIVSLAGAYVVDVRLGTWKLNLAKSKTGGAAVKSQIDVREAMPDGRVQVTRKRELVDGKSENYVFSYKYDGREYAVKGAPFDVVAVRRIDKYTTRFETSKKGTKYNVTGMTVISPDAQTMTQTSKGTDAAGKPVESSLVFNRK